jgi:chorismate mutase
VSDGRVLRAVRGAISVPEDTAASIRERTAELLEAVMERNGLRHEDLISIILTATEDLSAEFPAAGARDIGLSAVPLLCAREIPVPGSMPMCIRVLVHCTVEADREMRHAYLGEARKLRTDLPD